jgi:putative ABC transport system substrate-binding protein
VAAKNATKTIPIVTVSVGDPVEMGLVASLARPGGNITGLTSVVSPDIAGKQLELLKAAAPKISRVAVFWNPATPGAALSLIAAEGASLALGVHLQPVEGRSLDVFDSAFAAMTTKRAGALLVGGAVVFLTRRIRLANLALKNRLPAMCRLREHVEAGGLMSYGPISSELFRRAATYVDKILKGAKPAGLPVEQPTKFELVINMKTAKALGLTTPPSLLLRADQVIE